jgi:chromate transporter
MHRKLVEEKRWVGEQQFLHALNYCMLLPGPEAQQLAIYVGWLLHGYAGGLVAGTLFVLPGFFVMLGLSVLYAGLHAVGLVAGLFFGLKAAVLAVVIDATVRIGRRVLRNGILVALAACAFAALFFLRLPFPLVVLGAAAAGLAGGRLRPAAFAPQSHGPAAGEASRAADVAAAARLELRAAETVRASLARSLRVLVACGVLWVAPVVAAAALAGPDSVFVQEGIFFGKAAVVTFGGAYAVLAYIAQQAVERYGWLAPPEMLDGLGLAETTPGPLILVVEFVGFMGAFRAPGGLSPMAAGIAGAALTVWVTFVPCFLWIFLGAPYIESLRGNRHLGAALRAITAAVVGVIGNLAVWFGLHVLFGEVATVRGALGTVLVPRWSTLDPVALVIAAGSCAAILRFKVGMLPTLATAALAGVTYHLLVRG